MGPHPATPEEAPVTIRVALLGGDELVRRGLEGMLSTLGDFELGGLKERDERPIDIALVETFGLAAADPTLARAAADPFIRRVADRLARRCVLIPWLAEAPVGQRGLEQIVR